jgi:hypothetical protein
VGSGADTCLMALHMALIVEIKEGLAATTCSKTHLFLRHVRALPRRLQDMRADDVIMTYKPCGYVLQCHATVHHRVADHSRAWLYSTAPCS